MKCPKLWSNLKKKTQLKKIIIILNHVQFFIFFFYISIISFNGEINLVGKYIKKLFLKGKLLFFYQ